MIIYTIDLKTIRYSALVELLQKTNGTFKNYVFILAGSEYILTGLTYTQDGEGGQYCFNFQTDQDPVFRNVYIDKEVDRQNHNDWPHISQERPTRELHLTALDKLLLENDISYGK